MAIRLRSRWKEPFTLCRGYGRGREDPSLDPQNDEDILLGLKKFVGRAASWVGLI